MSHELFYTSAPKGLQPGSRGFCTVAATRGIPAALVEKLEALSGYRPLFPPHDADAALNPVVHAHLRINAGGKSYSVLSRICAAGLDYTDRANKFAHHVALEPNELPPGGPAWLLGQSGFMESWWDGEVQQLPSGRVPPHGNSTPAACQAWKHVTGDAGWGGVLTESFQHDPNRLVYLLFEPGMDPLPLLAEALALLPPERRWEVTFSTYFTGLPQGTLCVWRCVPRESSEAKAARKFLNALVLDLGINLGQAHGGALVAAAQGQITTLADNTPGNGVQSEVFAAAKAVPALPLEFPAAAPAPVPRSANDFLPPPLPSAGRGRREDSRGWLLSTAGGLAAGLLLSAGLVAAGYYSGILRLPDDAEAKEIAPKGPSESASARPLTNDANDTKAKLKRLNQELEERANENQLLKEEQKKGMDKAEQKQKEAERQIAALQEELNRSKTAKPKPVDPPNDVPKGPTERIQDLLQISRNPGFETKTVAEQLAELDSQVYGWVTELDKVRVAFAPKTVPYYSRLPSVIGTKDHEMTLPAELMDRNEKQDWTLHLLGLKGLKQKAEGERLNVIQEIKKEKETIERPLAHFKRERNRLLFQWDSAQDKAEDARRSVRNAILEITRGNRSFHLGLMRVTSDPKVTFPHVLDLRKEPAQFRTLERNKEEHLIQDLYLASVRCELGDQIRVLRALTDTAKLEWPGQVLIRLTKKDDRPGECLLTVQWIGDPNERPSRFVLHSLVAYTLVADERVEVWHVGAMSKKN
jgi:hypothetical protein